MKGICFVGDQHGNTSNFLELIDYIEKKYNPNSYFQVGDLGLMGKDFIKYLNNINKKLTYYDKKLYFIDGNHENHKWLNKKIEESIGEDGLVELASNVIYVPRGSFIELEGIKLFCVGGAFSNDREHRKLNKSYWEEEVFLPGQYEAIYDKINNSNQDIDIFITHDSPGDFNDLFIMRHFSSYSDYLEAGKFRDKLQNLYNLSGARINIHGHNHKYYYDEKSGDNMYDILQIEICLNCDNRQSKEEQFIIINKDDIDNFKNWNYTNVYDFFTKKRKR